MPAAELLYRTALELPPAKMAVINARAHPLLRQLCDKAKVCDLRQHFRPECNALSAMGLAAGKLKPPFELILLLPSKNKLQTLAWMATAMLQLNSHGRLLVAAANRHGAKSYESALHKLAGNIASACKSRCRIFSARKTAGLDETLAEQWIDAARPARIESLGLISQPGLFSWNRPDRGSLLLLGQLPDTFAGTGMDLCCGYGLLSEHLLRRSAGIERLHLVDADRLALACAEQNSAAWHDKIRLHWLDAGSEPLPADMEWVVCNPPFHSGQARDVGSGEAIISRACQSLKPGGRLYLVANRKLPYERTLATQLKEFRVLVEDDGFKVFEGVRSS